MIGSGRIRTFEGRATRFTVWPVCPLRYTPELAQRARCAGPNVAGMQYRTVKAALARNSLGVSQVQLKVGGALGEAVELDVAGGVGGEGWAGSPEGGAFDGDAVFVEESDA